MVITNYFIFSKRAAARPLSCFSPSSLCIFRASLRDPSAEKDHTPYTVHRTPYTIHYTPLSSPPRGEGLCPIERPVDGRRTKRWGSLLRRLIKPKDYSIITEGLPKDKPSFLYFSRFYCIYTMYIYTFLHYTPYSRNVLPTNDQPPTTRKSAKF